MDELKLFERLKEAYETSTRNYNSFEAAIMAVKWDETFYADEEYYFCKGDFIFTTPSLDPFEITKSWCPEAVFSDRSQIAFH